jgi:2-C-methyl-D-erythritol 2,4-cyclodiphosphate synthase
MKIKVGFGYDVHQLSDGEILSIGGVNIDYHRGCIAHSDGDVLIHAICDALLGAANLRDIGYHFPDTSTEFKKIDSKILLKRTLDLITNKGFLISNIDCTLCLQKPKIMNYIPKMTGTLSSILGIEQSDISIKATTTEKLGFVGREEGVAAYAVTLLIKE